MELFLFLYTVWPRVTDTLHNEFVNEDEYLTRVMNIKWMWKQATEQGFSVRKCINYLKIKFIIVHPEKYIQPT